VICNEEDTDERLLWVTADEKRVLHEDCTEIRLCLSLHHTIRQLFTWPSPPTAWFRNSFPASATLCLPNTT